MRIAVIGAGIAGLSLASKLQSEHEVIVFEKARGVGGRMSTRYAAPYQFDHGAQYFTARDQRFQAFLKPFIADGLIEPWTGKTLTFETGKKPFKRDRFENHYVAQPKMNQLCKALAGDLEIKLQSRIQSLNHEDGQWTLQADESFSGFDAVISTAPAPQTQELFAGHFAEELNQAQIAPTIALMLGYPMDLKLNFANAKVRQSSIAWLALNHLKPGRETDFSLLVHASQEWSSEHIDHTPEDLLEPLVSELCLILGEKVRSYKKAMIHKWRYALVTEAIGHDSLWDPDIKLGACGDWCIGGRVEAAYLSALDLFEKLVRQ